MRMRLSRKMVRVQHCSSVPMSSLQVPRHETWMVPCPPRDLLAAGVAVLLLLVATVATAPTTETPTIPMPMMAATAAAMLVGVAAIAQPTSGALTTPFAMATESPTT